MEKQYSTTALKGWKIYSIAREERIVRLGDKRGYVWVVAQKPETI